MRVALMLACFNDTLFPAVGRATVELLERLGVEVEFPPAQTCCGQMHHNTGYADRAGELARRTVAIFEPYPAIVVPSASCAGMVREVYPQFAAAAGDAAFIDAVNRLTPRVHELSEFLVNVLGVEDVGARFPHRVTYHPTCHALRVLHMADLPLRLLRQVEGIDLVQPAAADQCCGFGGTFAVKNAATSLAMLDDKLRHLRETGAEVCTAADTSCLMHIGGALSRRRAGMRTMHFAEILAQTEAGA